MKKLIGLILSLWLVLNISAAWAWNDSTGTRSKNESKSTDAASSVLYGKYGTSIVPVKLDAEGKVFTSGGSGGDEATTVSDSTTINFTLTGADITAAFLPAGVGTSTWGSGSAMSWTFNVSAGTDPVLTPGDNSFGFNVPVTAPGFSSSLSSGSVGYIHLKEDPDNGTNYVGFKAPSALSVDLEFTLPSADGTSGQVLKTNGSKVLSWVTAASGDALVANPLSQFAATTSAQLYGVISDETGSASGTPLVVFNQAPTINGATLTGAIDGGGATIEIPNGTDPDTTVTGQVSMDTDGANITSDVSIRGFDGTNQFLVARKLKTIQGTVIKPQDAADAVRDKLVVWSNESGMTFTITEIKAWSGTDDTSINVEEYDADGQNNATIDTLEIATNGTGVFTADETTITGATIEAGHLIAIDFDDTDDPDYVKVSISGWYNSNVD